MSRTTDKPKASAKPAAKRGAARKGAAKTGAGKLARPAERRSAVPRPPSLAEAQLRMRAGRTFWDDLTPEQRAAGLDGPEASGRAPTLPRPAER